MPLKDGIIYTDNTYSTTIATCQTKGYISRVLGFVSTEGNKDAAHVGSAFHSGFETFLKGGTKLESLAAFRAKYDELLPSEEDGWDNWAPKLRAEKSVALPEEIIVSAEDEDREALLSEHPGHPSNYGDR